MIYAKKIFLVATTDVVDVVKERSTSTKSGAQSRKAPTKLELVHLLFPYLWYRHYGNARYTVQPVSINRAWLMLVILVLTLHATTWTLVKSKLFRLAAINDKIVKPKIPYQ